MRWRRGLVGLAVAVFGCQPEPEPRDQWLVTLATDAPLPQFGDRLVIEILRGDDLACAGCRRIFGIAPEDLPASFGIAAPDDTTDESHRLRVRLYRTDHTGADGSPEGGAHLDVLARLPQARGHTPVTVVASMDCFGVTAHPGEDLSCDPETKALAPTRLLGPRTDLPAVGSWPMAGPDPCEGPIPEDMVCIEGGAFLLGSPDHFHLSVALASEPEHLVRISPFALDRDEVTVGTVRALVSEGRAPAPLLPDPDPMAPSGTCSYLGTTDSSHDDWPVNCVTHGVAEAICAALGRRLPTEAEWEYAAGQRDLETPYPWGYDDDVCNHAIVALGRLEEAHLGEPITCRLQPDGSLGPWGFSPAGHEKDVSAQGLRNMAGNLAEWVADRFLPYSGGCFSPEEGSLLVDPVCEQPAPHWAYRGSGWLGLPGDAQVFIRKRHDGISTNIGLRCALSR